MSELSDPASSSSAALKDLPSGELSPEAPARPKTSSVRPHGAIDWSRLTLAVGLLVGVSVSIYLALRLFAMPAAQLDPFLSTNALDAALRKKMLLQLLAAAAVPGLLSVLVVARFRGDGVHWLSLAADRLCPLIVVCFVPTLLNYRQWYSQPLPYLVLLLGVVLLLERLFFRALGGGQGEEAAPVRRQGLRGFRGTAPELAAEIARDGAVARWLPLAFVVLAALGYAVHASYYTIQRHHLLGTAGFDLGIFDNLMFNAMHGRPFKSTVAIPDGSYLSNHAEYGMFLFVPLYWLRPGSETLLVLQSTFMGIAAIPLYFFATTQVSRPLAAAIACVYVFYAPLHGPNYYDFHWMPQSMFFFFWLFYAIAKGQKIAIVLLTLVIASIREDAAFGLIATGIFLVMIGFRPLLGAVLTVVSMAWFLLVKFVIMPWAGPWWFADIYRELVAAGESGYGSVVKTILVNPNYFLRTLLNEAKATYVLHLLAPLAFLSVRHPALWVLMLPGFIVTLMTTGYAPTTSISFQYTTNWIPFLFAAAAIALHLRGERLGRAAARGSVLALCFGVLCHSYVFGSIFQQNTFVGGFSKVDFEPTPEKKERYRNLRALADMIPPDASVAATELEIPHVSTRLDAYTLKVSAGEADYLLINRNHLDDDARRRVREAFVGSDYGLVARKNEFFLLKRGHESPETAAALSALGLHRAREKPQHHEPGSIIGPGGNCISMGPPNTTELIVKSCKSEPKQRWLLSVADGRLRYQSNPDLCLGVPKRRNFESLKALPCTEDATAWIFDRTAIHNFSEKCVDLLNGDHDNGAQIGVWECLKNNNQQWSITKLGEVRLLGLTATKCWTVKGDAPGTPLQLHDCNGSESQRFTFSRNKIRRGDKCLDLRSDKALEAGKPEPKAPKNGWHVQLWPCDDARTLQEFHFSGPIAQKGKCVDSLHSRTADGSVVGVYECIGNDNQEYDVHF